MSKGKAHERALARARDRREQERRAQRRRRNIVAAVLVAGLFVVVGIVAASIGRRGGEPTSALTDPPGSPAAEEPTGDDGDASTAQVACGAAVPPAAAEEKPQFDAEPGMVIDPEATYRATIETSCGDVVVELLAGAAPNTVNNFVFLAREGFYDGLTFHRIVPEFVIQGGDPAGDGTGGPGYRIGEETALPEAEGYQTGSLAMAKAQAPNTTGSQFFIVLEGGKPILDPQPVYSLFGQVVEGMDVVELIAAVPLDGQSPLETAYIERVTIEELPTEGGSE
ncbi:MAG: peptidylprolyl isomerase [Nitriliruptorales bacterium]